MSKRKGYKKFGNKPPQGWATRYTLYAKLVAEVSSQPGQPTILFNYASSWVEIPETRNYREVNFMPPENLGAYTPFLDIPIDRNCFVHIELDPDVNWQWATEIAAVSNKEKYYKSHYFQLRYWSGTDWIKRRDVPSGYRCTKIIFGARYNDDLPADITHGFNFDLDLRYPGAQPGEIDILPVTLDPDIRNPSQ